MDTQSRVEAVIANQTGTNAGYDAELESFDMFQWVTLMCQLEDEFEIEISDMQFEKNPTVEGICAYIESVSRQEGVLSAH